MSHFKVPPDNKYISIQILFATEFAKFLPGISSIWPTKSTKLMMIIFDFKNEMCLQNIN